MHSFRKEIKTPSNRGFYLDYSFNEWIIAIWMTFAVGGMGIVPHPALCFFEKIQFSKKSMAKISVKLIFLLKSAFFACAKRLVFSMIMVKEKGKREEWPEFCVFLHLF